jgi:F-type H+-transporting ATPase subunit delta
MLNNPVVQTDKKLKVFKELFSGKMDSLTEQFIVLVAQKGRERYLPDIATDFVVKYRAYKNIELAKVKSAAPLTSDQQANIQKGLSEMLPKGTSLELELLVDPSLIGGFIIEFGDKVYDASVADKLDEMRKDLFSKNLFVSKIIA